MLKENNHEFDFILYDAYDERDTRRVTHSATLG